VKVLRIVRIYSKFIILIQFLPSAHSSAMTPVNRNDICTTDQATRPGVADGADKGVNLDARDSPRRTLTLKADAARRSATGAVRSHAHEGALAAAVPTPLKRLTAGRKELAIAHAGATYVLRVTKANKLILTKDSEETLS
jgi:hemin uptake protein HemP